LIGDPDGTAVVSIDPPHQRTDEEKAAFRPTNLREKVSRFLEAEGEPRSQNRVLIGVEGKRDWIIAALKLLREEGYVTGKIPHESIKPYRKADDPKAEK
jgi:hypothetical protein